MNQEEQMKLVKSLIVLAGMSEVYNEELENISKSIFAKYKTKTKKRVEDLAFEMKSFVNDWYNSIIIDEERNKEDNVSKHYYTTVNLVEGLMNEVRDSSIENLINLSDLITQYKNGAVVVSEKRMLEICEEFRKYGKLGLTKDQAFENFNSNNYDRFNQEV